MTTVFLAIGEFLLGAFFTVVVAWLVLFCSSVQSPFQPETRKTDRAFRAGKMWGQNEKPKGIRPPPPPEPPSTTPSASR